MLHLTPTRTTRAARPHTKSSELLRQLVNLSSPANATTCADEPILPQIYKCTNKPVVVIQFLRGRIDRAVITKKRILVILCGGIRQTLHKNLEICHRVAAQRAKTSKPSKLITE